MWTSMDSPLGEIRIIANGRALTAVEFVSLPLTGASTRSSTARAAVASAGRPVGDRDDAHPVLVEAVRQLRAYFAGDLKDFDLPLEPAGTPFQLKVWQQLRRIGYGETTSYGELAIRLGMTPAASRAVGAANGRNPIGIVIPCHRVVGANGLMSGYAGGVERKQQLLDLEQGALF